MTQLTKTELQIGQLIRKYRKERGWTLSEEPKDGISILHVIKQRFGEVASPRLLKTETFKNMETSGSHHTDPTAIELYQIACVLEVPMLALMIDYDTPYTQPYFDPKQTVFQIAQSESMGIQEFRGFREIKNTEERARLFAVDCEELVKVSKDQIEDNLRADWLANKCWPCIDPAKVLVLNMEGFEASPTTFKYYKRAELLLKKAGVTVILPHENSMPSHEAPLYVKGEILQRSIQRKGEKDAKAINLLNQAIGAYSADYRKILEKDIQEQCVQYLWEIGVDEDSINTIIAKNNWNPNLFMDSSANSNDNFSLHNHFNNNDDE